jgi:osmotically inducible protein OsmC
MALSAGLGKSGTPPDRLSVSARVTIDEVDGGFKVVSSALTVKGRVPGIDDVGFAKAADDAKDGCPVSQALMGNAELSVVATLER